MRIAVCDNDEFYTSQIETLIKKHLTQQLVDFTIHVFSNGNTLAECNEKNPYDVVFLDIVMPDIDGFETAKKLKNVTEDIILIFVSSHENLVFDSFEFNPFYYINKNTPSLVERRMSDICSRLAEMFKRNYIITLEMPHHDIRRIKCYDIIYIKSDKNYCIYCLKDGEEVKQRIQLSEAHKPIEKFGFVRVHNRYVVNIAHIKSIDYSNEIITLKNGEKIRMSRSIRSSLMEQFTELKRRGM